MTKLTTQGVVRDILTRNPDLDTDEVIRRAKVKGVGVPDAKIRHAVHNLRNNVKAQVAGTTKVAPTADRETTPAKIASVAATPALETSTATPDLGGMLTNVLLVNTIVGLCGSIENVRRAAGAVQACGGVETFLQCLELVAKIRESEAKG